MIAEAMPRRNADFDQDVHDLCSGRIPTTSKIISYGGASDTAANDAAINAELEAIIMEFDLRQVEPVRHEPAPAPEVVLENEPESVAPESEPTPEPASEPESTAKREAFCTIAEIIASQEFAAARDALRKLDTDRVIESLRETSQTIRQGDRTNYAPALRTRLVAASLELNDRGVMSKFRPIRRANFDVQNPHSCTAHDETLANDLRVIDLDYIAKHHTNGHGEIFDSLLNGDGSLNWCRAAEFVSKDGKAGKKAELLCLDEQEQIETLMFMNEAQRARWNRLCANKWKHQGKIKAAIKAGRKLDELEYTWQIYALCVMHDWNARAVVDSANRLPDKRMSDRTVRRTIPWLKGVKGLPKNVEDEIEATAA